MASQNKQQKKYRQYRSRLLINAYQNFDKKISKIEDQADNLIQSDSEKQ